VIDIATRLFDPTSLLLVVGGSLVAAMLRSTFPDMRRAVRALGPLVRRKPDSDALVARRGLHQLERIAELKGTGCADHIETDCAFLRRAALKLADAPSATAFAEWSQEELDERAVRHASAIACWRAAADAAPSIGMIGTVLGLIGMFAAMDDPARMGPAMALAMLTTFYGLALGTLIFGPITARLERLSEAEIAWQRPILARMGRLARAEACPAGEWIKRSREAAE
jgi:chemotaxis protein MotA